jgi:hypothetical protein
MGLELFMKIPGHENYKASTKGRTFSIKKNKFLKPRVSNNGYYQIYLYKDKKGKNYLLHRLVAFTFLFNEEGYEQVDHIDRDKTNNNLHNLRFCSSAQNHYNKNICKNNNSGFKGVYWNKHNKKYMARIGVNRKKNVSRIF